MQKRSELFCDRRARVGAWRVGRDTKTSAARGKGIRVVCFAQASRACVLRTLLCAAFERFDESDFDRELLLNVATELIA